MKLNKYREPILRQLMTVILKNIWKTSKCPLYYERNSVYIFLKIPMSLLIKNIQGFNGYFLMYITWKLNENNLIPPYTGQDSQLYEIEKYILYEL